MNPNPSWVPNTDTLHALIRDFREQRKILLNIEHRLMLQMAPDYDSLTVMEKVKPFCEPAHPIRPSHLPQRKVPLRSRSLPLGDG
jgi:phosphatidylinositol kinase/protein kinase (PI-3  family)